MEQYRGDPDYSHASPETFGVLLTNLGTPDAPTPAAVRRFLAEFLSDPRVVELPRVLWRVLLHGVILRIRPRRTALAYQKIWTEAGSPLLDISQRQASALEKALTARSHNKIIVALGMRYGNPAIAEALEGLRQHNARRLLVLPLYPQYSATTTASTFDAVVEVLRRWRWIPEFRFVTHYHDHEPYIDALARSIEQSWNQRTRGERLLFSFHGIPQRYFRAGDPYHCQCQVTARLVAQRLGLDPTSWAIAFQSRVGRQKWLQPYTDQLLKRWARDGVGNVDVVCPGFAADCIETLEEIAIQDRTRYLKAGGQALNYIAALNDRSDHIEGLAQLVHSRTADWCTAKTVDLAEREARAQALGAAR